MIDRRRRALEDKSQVGELLYDRREIGAADRVYGARVEKEDSEERESDSGCRKEKREEELEQREKRGRGEIEGQKGTEDQRSSDKEKINFLY